MNFQIGLQGFVNKEQKLEKFILNVAIQPDLWFYFYMGNSAACGNVTP